ncbi:MAG: MarR family transcriptional regulator [Acidobacteriota bacterium]|nr:MarR family transcriptional regulator [Acidobacteriota bacterium]
MDPGGVHLWLILWKAYESVRAHADRHIRATGLGFSDFAVLETLLHKGAQPVNAIGHRVYLTSGSITAAVDRLEGRGLVKRCDEPSDRRTRMVHLTPAGRKLIECAFAAHAAAMEHAASGLEAAEREQLARLLKKLGCRAEELL